MRSWNRKRTKIKTEEIRIKYGLLVNNNNVPISVCSWRQMKYTYVMSVI